MYPIFYDCPKCGKKESSHDGYHFCGKCEEEYRREQLEMDQADADFSLSERTRTLVFRTAAEATAFDKWKEETCMVAVTAGEFDDTLIAAAAAIEGAEIRRGDDVTHEENNGNGNQV